jgi:two-component system sensor histidine kinase YcbA
MKPFHNITWLVSIATILFGQIYLRPFYTDFRFSLGVVAFGMFLLLYKLKPIDIAITIIGIFGFRVLLAYISGIPITTALLTHYPAALFYLCYALVIMLCHIRSQLINPLWAFFILFFADSFSNWFELFLRGDLHQLTLGIKAQSIFLTASIRSVLILATFFLVKFYPEMFHKEAEKRKMATWILIQTKLYNEILFLNKSEADIEKAMKNSHALYQMSKSETASKEISKQALSVSRDVHEIKKDYRRIRQALTSLLPKDLPLTRPSANELIQFLCDDLEAYSLSQHKQIQITRTLDTTLPEVQLMDTLSIINNLVINAIDASNSYDTIELSFINTGHLWTLSVKDEGSGILEEDFSMIFDPGYSTKFDPETGEMSTGIGLAQVEYIVKQSLNGNIHVSSKIGTGTQFTIEFPHALEPHKGEYHEL